jgi:hypothetical protein
MAAAYVPDLNKVHPLGAASGMLDFDRGGTDPVSLFLLEYNRLVGWPLYATHLGARQNACWKINHRKIKRRGSIIRRCGRRVGEYGTCRQSERHNVTHVIAHLCLGPPPAHMVGPRKPHAAHLCHHAWCWNPRHLVWSTMDHNQLMTDVYRGTITRWLKVADMEDGPTALEIGKVGTWKQALMEKCGRQDFMYALQQEQNTRIGISRGQPKEWLEDHWNNNRTVLEDMLAACYVVGYEDR